MHLDLSGVDFWPLLNAHCYPHTHTQVSSLLQDFDKNSSVTMYITFLMNQIKTMSAATSDSSDAKAAAPAKVKDEFEADDDDNATTGSGAEANEQPVWAIEALYSIVKNSRVFKDKSRGEFQPCLLPTFSLHTTLMDREGESNALLSHTYNSAAMIENRPTIRSNTEEP